MECSESASIVMPPNPIRKRSPKWELTEKALLNVSKTTLSILKIKQLIQTQLKVNRAWQLLQKRFNELNSRERSLLEIKQQWRTMKLDAKKSLSDYKKSCKLTGGGEKPPSPNLDTQSILSLIPQEFEEDMNVFHSDGQLNQKKEVNNEMSKRDVILTGCITAETELKIQQMTEAHEWARKEHLLRLNNLELENKILLSKLGKE